MAYIITKIIHSPFGEMLAGSTDKGICLLEFTDTDRLAWQIPSIEKSFSHKTKKGNSLLIEKLEEQLQAYFSGDLEYFDLALETQGTPFQMKAWDALLSIPYAETRSYQEQATLIGNPKAFRAVASANRNNRISIIIPCHRVIAKNGSLAGYGGGLERKAFLIDLEKKSKEKNLGSGQVCSFYYLEDP